MGIAVKACGVTRSFISKLPIAFRGKQKLYPQKLRIPFMRARSRGAIKLLVETRGEDISVAHHKRIVK